MAAPVGTKSSSRKPVTLAPPRKSVAGAQPADVGHEIEADGADSLPAHQGEHPAKGLDGPVPQGVPRFDVVVQAVGQGLQNQRLDAALPEAAAQPLPMGGGGWVKVLQLRQADHAVPHPALNGQLPGQVPVGIEIIGEYHAVTPLL